MPNILDVNGLQIKTFNEIKEELITSLRGIYGNDINVDSNSPDGQLVNILAQAIIDQLELIQQAYNSFDPASPCSPCFANSHKAPAFSSLTHIKQFMCFCTK